MLQIKEIQRLKYFRGHNKRWIQMMNIEYVATNNFRGSDADGKILFHLVSYFVLKCCFVLGGTRWYTARTRTKTVQQFSIYISEIPFLLGCSRIQCFTWVGYMVGQLERLFLVDQVLLVLSVPIVVVSEIGDKVEFVFGGAGQRRLLRRVNQVTREGLYWFRLAPYVHCSADHCIALENVLQRVQVSQ